MWGQYENCVGIVHQNSFLSQVIEFLVAALMIGETPKDASPRMSRKRRYRVSAFAVTGLHTKFASNHGIRPQILDRFIEFGVGSKRS